MMVLAAKRHSNTICLVGDLDDVELLQALEEVFQICISDAEAETILALGDACKVVRARLSQKDELGHKCLTAMAYYRLNRAMSEQGKLPADTRVGPPSDMTPRAFQKLLEERSGLCLDFLTKASFGTSTLGLLQLVTWVIGPVGFSGFSAFAVSVAVFALSHGIWRLADRLDPRVWTYEGTLGTLSQQASEVNIGALAAQGGAWSDADIWRSMTAVIQDHTGYPASKMNLETKFI